MGVLRVYSDRIVYRFAAAMDLEVKVRTGEGRTGFSGTSSAMKGRTARGRRRQCRRSRKNSNNPRIKEPNTDPPTAKPIMVRFGELETASCVCGRVVGGRMAAEDAIAEKLSVANDVESEEENILCDSSEAGLVDVVEDKLDEVSVEVRSPEVGLEESGCSEVVACARVDVLTVVSWVVVMTSVKVDVSSAVVWLVLSMPLW